MPSITGSVQAVASFGRFSISNETHAAGRLQRESRVITERRHLDALRAHDFDQQRSLRSRYAFSVQWNVTSANLMSTLIRTWFSVEMLFELMTPVFDNAQGRIAAASPSGQRCVPACFRQVP